MKKRLKSIFLLPILAIFVAPVFFLTGCRGDDAPTFSLATAPATRNFVSEHRLYTFPAVRGSGHFTYEWSVLSGYEFAAVNDCGTRFRMIPFTGQTTANIVFRATVTAGTRTVNLNYNLQVRDPVTNEFDRLFSSNQSGRHTYLAQGIAAERVFGLWDIADTTHNIYTPETVYLSDCDGYQKSGDTMFLAWRYRGNVNIEIQLLDENENVIANPQNDDVVQLVTSTNANGEIDRVDISFVGAGVRTIRATGTSTDSHNNHGLPPATYSFTYDIRDAVNAFVFDEVREVERNARFDYILNGVFCTRTNTQLIDPISEQEAAAFYTPVASRLFSNRFATIRRTHALPISGSVSTYTFAEFERWAPAFTYRDLVIRDNMRTWEEATWFFGNVFGNGHQIDATPYSTNAQQRVRNAHGSKSMGGGAGLEQQDMRGRRGSGWWERYAFYMLGNFTTLDNITLIGMTTRWDGHPIQNIANYNTISVLGTSNLGGVHFDWQNGNRHDEGVFQHGMYTAGIRIQNSILERGFILVGVSYTPNQEYPVTIDTSVLRYAGFTGVWGRSWSGDEYGLYVRENNILGQVDGLYERPNSPVRPGLPKKFGNFIETRNLTVYEIATAAIVIDENIGGTHVTVSGENNNFLTWLRLSDLILPSFRLPGTHFSSITTIDAAPLAQNAIGELLADPANSHGHVPEGNTSWLNLLYLSIEEQQNNTISFNNSNLTLGHTPDMFINFEVFVGFEAAGGVADGLFINAYLFTVPTPSSTHLITHTRQRELFQGLHGGIPGLINSKNINNN
ncbi:MAG: hypothetical protein FWE45_05380 [Firmicutes bacterium]|nr:hypothetical protein [Bacillota bacterium]